MPILACCKNCDSWTKDNPKDKSRELCMEPQSFYAFDFTTRFTHCPYFTPKDK